MPQTQPQMFAAVARQKGTLHNFMGVSLGGQPFFGEKGIMEYMIEKMGEKYPTLEYELREVQFQ